MQEVFEALAFVKFLIEVHPHTRIARAAQSTWIGFGPRLRVNPIELPITGAPDDNNGLWIFRIVTKTFLSNRCCNATLLANFRLPLDLDRKSSALVKSAIRHNEKVVAIVNVVCADHPSPTVEELLNLEFSGPSCNLIG
ncbi:hypothetical protein A9D66_08050 [Xanthomonas citri pv. glycines str. 12-2]|nr:hypothetical protein A9D66_08050 [Xanthomonas citri pv. glycines str. 12-2]